MKLLLNKPNTPDGIGVYIHIPFCSKKCGYCNFYSACIEEKTVYKYLDALIKKIKDWGGKICRPVDSLYIGGGTPSALCDKISLILQAARESFNITNNAEITVEMNPEKVPDAFLAAAYKNGANRLSIGMQSANEDELLMLGRRHKNSDVKAAVEKARAIGFENISLDIMTALPYSTTKALKKTLDFAVSLNVEHISAYILKLEPKTLLYSKNLPMPNADCSAEQYLFVCEFLKAHGFSHYEISNFAKKGFEGKHNLKYWQLKDYIGIGPSAHSFYNGKRFYYKADLKEFIENPTVLDDDIGGSAEEFVMLSLRIKEGLSFDSLKNLYGIEKNAELMKFIEMLEKQNLAEFFKKENVLSLTDEGMLVSNTIITEILERLI